MSISGDIIVEAIYQNGQIRLLEPINLPNNVRIMVQIIAQPAHPKGNLAKYKGILAGQDDFSFEEIQSITHDTTDTHFNKLIDQLNQDTK